jgi:G3E family GTPase
MTQIPPVPVVLVAGLHGGARLRAVEGLLQAVPGAVAVHHDLGGLGDGDGDVVRELRTADRPPQRTRIELVHSCLSCTLREDLLPTLIAMARTGEYPLLVVDAWDSIEPRPVAEALTLTQVDGHPITEELHLASVVTAVDAGQMVCDLAGGELLSERRLQAAEEDGRSIAETLARQIEYPTVIALDRFAVPHELAEQTEALTAQLNPAAALLDINDLGAVGNGAFDLLAAAARTDPTTATPVESCEVGEVRTVAWKRTRPMHPVRLHNALESIVSPALRSRGRFWLANRPDTMLVWESAGDEISLEPAGPWLASLPEGARELVNTQRRAVAALDWHPEHGDRCQCLWFTGIGLDAERIHALLDSCLLTEEELHTPGGLTVEDPFAEFLDDEESAPTAD